MAKVYVVALERQGCVHYLQSAACDAYLAAVLISEVYGPHLHPTTYANRSGRRGQDAAGHGAQVRAVELGTHDDLVGRYVEGATE